MKPLLVFAMKEESQDVFQDYHVLHTGIGKVNASYVLTKQIIAQKPSCVVNMGTAGSRKHPGGSIVNCTRFVQRDMDVTALGVDKYKTPFSSDPIELDWGIRIEGYTEGTCGSGDNFDTSDEASNFDVVDMEAFALSLICQREGIPFISLKYVSDGADDDADMDWQDSLRKAALALREVVERVNLQEIVKIDMKRAI